MLRTIVINDSDVLNIKILEGLKLLKSAMGDCLKEGSLLEAVLVELRLRKENGEKNLQNLSKDDFKQIADIFVNNDYFIERFNEDLDDSISIYLKTKED